jgi:hypothetical protein
MGSAAYWLAAKSTYVDGDCLLEIGAERGDGSTAWLASLAEERHVPFYSIDPDGQGTITGRAEDILARWSAEPPRFTWADGYDWPYSWCEGGNAEWCRSIFEDYASRGMPLTEEASMESHRQISELLHGVTRVGAVVVFDDTWRRNGEWTGKGGTAVPWLTGTGLWEVQEEMLPECVDEWEPVAGYAVLRRR